MAVGHRVRNCVYLYATASQAGSSQVDRYMGTYFKNLTSCNSLWAATCRARWAATCATSDEPIIRAEEALPANRQRSGT